MSTFPLSQGDTLPILTSSLVDGAGEAIDLTTATVQFRMRATDGGALVIDSPASIVGVATLGNVSYSWQSGDTDTPGYYFAEWRVTYGGGGILTVPNETPILIRTRARLEDLAAISAQDLRLIRDQIGDASPPSDADLAALLAELSTVDRVVLSIREQRFAAALVKPAKYAIEGDSSFDYSANLAAMQKELDGQRRAASGLATGQLVADWPR